MSYIDLYTVNVYSALLLLVVWAFLGRIYLGPSAQRYAYFFECGAVLVLAGMISYDLSLRPISILGDTIAYYNFYQDLLCGFEGGFEAAFSFLAKTLIFFEMTHVALFWLVPFSIIVSFFVLTVVVFGKKSLLPVVLVSLLMFYPFFFSLAVNVIRQGFAVAFLTMSLSMLWLDKKWASCLFLVLAFSFHKSALIFLPLVIWTPLFTRASFLKVLGAWVVVSLLSFVGVLSHISAFVFGQLSAFDISANYSNLKIDTYPVGFRWEFWLFSSLPIICIYLYMKFVDSPLEKAVEFMNFIAFLGLVHIALLDVAYNDRFGIYGWFYYPIVIAFAMRAIIDRTLRACKTRLLFVDTL